MLIACHKDHEGHNLPCKTVWGIQETPEQRRAKLAERARALADRKEAARVAEAQARLEQQFVESCDELRQMESRKRLQLIMQQRTGQVLMASSCCKNMTTGDAFANHHAAGNMLFMTWLPTHSRQQAPFLCSACHLDMCNFPCQTHLPSPGHLARGVWRPNLASQAARLLKV